VPATEPLQLKPTKVRLIRLAPPLTDDGTKSAATAELAGTSGVDLNPSLSLRLSHECLDWAELAQEARPVVIIVSDSDPAGTLLRGRNEVTRAGVVEESSHDSATGNRALPAFVPSFAVH
jgi:hypothetical protein